MKILADYQGRYIRLTEERLVHILAHREMLAFQDLTATLATVLRQPELVKQSRTDQAVNLYYRYRRDTQFGDKWLCVVVKHLESDAFIITAYLTDTLKQGETLWPNP